MSKKYILIDLFNNDYNKTIKSFEIDFVIKNSIDEFEYKMIFRKTIYSIDDLKKSNVLLNSNDCDLIIKLMSKYKSIRKIEAKSFINDILLINIIS